MDYLTDPVAGSPSKNRKIIGAICLHVDDLFCTGADLFRRQVLDGIRETFQVGSEDKNDVLFVGQRVRWKTLNNNPKGCLEVDQEKAVEEIHEVEFDKSLKDDVACTPALRTEYRSVLGSLNWLQSRTQFQSAYRFSRCASASAAPTIGDVRAINKLVRSVRAEVVKLCFWPLKGPVRVLGCPDASYRNNSDKRSQRGQCVFLCEQRVDGHKFTRGSLVDYESQKYTEQCYLQLWQNSIL